jgi:hypothetical protein
MNRSEIKELLTDVKVVKPCGVQWETMTGDEQARVCGQCNLTVHNLSAMTDREAAILVKKRKTERTCVFFRKKADGSVAVDNCPQQLKMVRNRLFGVVAATLMSVALGIYLSSSPTAVTTQTYFSDPRYGLVDPRYGQSNEISLWTDMGYDTARDISRIVTLVSFVIVFFWPMSREKKESTRRIILELFALASVPVLIHIAGTFIANNFCGLGGGM